MARLVIENPTPHKGGRVIHCADGVARRRCRICGCTVYGRNCGICRDCLSKRLNGANDARGGVA